MGEEIKPSQKDLSIEEEKTGSEVDLDSVFEGSKLSPESQNKMKEGIQKVLKDGGLVLEEPVAVINPTTSKPELATRKRFGESGFYVDTIIDSEGKNSVSEYYAIGHPHSHGEAIWTNSKGEEISNQEQRGIAEFDEKLAQERHKLYDEIETIEKWGDELNSVVKPEIDFSPAWWGLEKIIKDKLNTLRQRRDAINKAYDYHSRFRG